MIQFTEYLKTMVVDGDPKATYHNIMNELSARTLRLYVVDYTYKGKFYNAFVPAISTIDIMVAVEEMSKRLPVAKNMHVDFSKLLYIGKLNVSLLEMQSSLIAYFLYFYRNIVDITKFKDNMITYFESIDDYEKCGVLKNYSTLGLTLL
jgi:hypothetical protein